jgi:hypothetical protein
MPVRAWQRAAGGDLQEPWMGQQERPVLFRERGEPCLPWHGGVAGNGDLAVSAVGHDVEQLGFAGHVAVEGHGGDAQLVGEPAHG